MLFRRAIAFGVLAVPLLLLPAVAPAKEKTYRITAVEEDPETKWRPAEVLERTRLGVRFQIRYLDTAAARAAIGASLGRNLDLLPGRVDERRPGFIVFLLQVDNGSPSEVLFNPGQARLFSNKGDMKFALDYSALYEVARRFGPEGPELDDLAAIFFDRLMPIAPGGSARKLLAFDAPRDDRFREFEIRLAEVNVGAESIDFVFPFRKIRER